MELKSFMVVLASGSAFQRVEVEAEGVQIFRSGDHFSEVVFVNPKGICGFNPKFVAAVYEV